MSSIVKRVEPFVKEIVQEEGCYLVDIEYVKEGPNWYLRIYADKEGRIDIDDCAKLSERIGEALDKMQPDPFPKAYFLEVSSPGAERPLKDEEAIKAAIGEYVHFDYYVPQFGEKQHEGTLLEVSDETYTLEVQVMSRKKKLTIDKSAVSHARLAVKF